MKELDEEMKYLYHLFVHKLLLLCLNLSFRYVAIWKVGKYRKLSYALDTT